MKKQLLSLLFVLGLGLSSMPAFAADPNEQGQQGPENQQGQENQSGSEDEATKETFLNKYILNKTAGLVALGAVVLGGAGYYWWQSQNQEEESN